MRYRMSEFKLNLIEGYLSSSFNHTFLRALNLSDNPNEYGKQLLYRPMNTFNASIHANYNTLSLMYNFNFTGKRYTNRRNDEHLAYEHH